VIGKDDYFVFSAETAAKLQENDKRIMAAKKAENIEESGFLRGKHRTYITNKVPLIGEDGNVIGICGVGFDITRQKELEKELKDLHRNLERRRERSRKGLLSSMRLLINCGGRNCAIEPWPISPTTGKTGQIWTGPYNISLHPVSGYTPQQFVENPSLYREIIVPEDQDLWKKHYHDSRKEPKAREIQFRIRSRNGAIRWIEHACQPVRGDQGELMGFRASNRDITKRKEGEIKLQNAYAEIAELKVQLEADRTYLREEIRLEHDYEHIIGNSDVLKYVLFKAEQIAPRDTTVLILGETGTGKELIARTIHNASPRRERPLIKVDCAAMPANLIESEFFGHEKGAFTGAVERRIGRFELADGATIFLDEIGELPIALQQKLLRVLQDGEFERLGSSRVRKTDVRVIAATNRNLKEDVGKGRFREDLLYRLNVFPISIPPLRERAEDIPLLVNWMIKRIQRRLGKHIKRVPKDVMDVLKTYPWPGNVRELENVIERAAIVTPGSVLQLAEPLGSSVSTVDKQPDAPIKTLSEIEKEYILKTLTKTHWNISGRGGAAELLGLNSSTLRGRMRKHGIRRPL